MNQDILQLMLTSDDVLELIETQSPSICKVDFINNVIAFELLNVVDNWYDGLRNIPNHNLLQGIIKQYGKTISEFVRYSVPIMFLCISYYYSPIFPFFEISDNLSNTSLLKAAIVFSAIFMLGFFVGKRIEGGIDRAIDKLENYPRFNITKGDQNYINDFDKNNNKVVCQISKKILTYIFGTLITFPVKLFLEYVIRHLSTQ